jgi:hypothetical protein
VITRESIDRLEKAIGQLEGIHSELSALNKKSPNDGVNKFKLQFVNVVLRDCNSLLGETYRPAGGFEEFNEDDVPSNSDVTFIASQYLQALEKFRTDNIKESGFRVWSYDVPLGEVQVRAAPPAKLKR